MKYTGYIYKYTSPEGKVYIGQTKDLDRRIYQHKLAAMHNDLNRFHRALRRFGIDNFDIQVIFYFKTNELERLHYLLNTMEKYYIQKYKSYDPLLGYNATSGGSKGSKNYKENKKQEERLERKKQLEAAYKLVDIIWKNIK